MSQSFLSKTAADALGGKLAPGEEKGLFMAAHLTHRVHLIFPQAVGADQVIVLPGHPQTAGQVLGRGKAGQHLHQSKVQQRQQLPGAAVKAHIPAEHHASLGFFLFHGLFQPGDDLLGGDLGILFPSQSFRQALKHPACPHQYLGILQSLPGSQGQGIRTAQTASQQGDFHGCSSSPSSSSCFTTCS